MKKLLMIIAIIIATLSSCTKKNITCELTTCGAIISDGITDNCYWLEIENDCSKNKKKFCFAQNVWMNAYVGTNFCVTGVEPW
jgi:deoxycytidylate deaminase